MICLFIDVCRLNELLASLGVDGGKCRFGSLRGMRAGQGPAVVCLIVQHAWFQHNLSWQQTDTTRTCILPFFIIASSCRLPCIWFHILRSGVWFAGTIDPFNFTASHSSGVVCLIGLTYMLDLRYHCSFWCRLYSWHVLGFCTAAIRVYLIKPY